MIIIKGEVLALKRAIKQHEMSLIRSFKKFLIQRGISTPEGFSCPSSNLLMLPLLFMQVQLVQEMTIRIMVRLTKQHQKRVACTENNMGCYITLQFSALTIITLKYCSMNLVTFRKIPVANKIGFLHKNFQILFATGLLGA